MWATRLSYPWSWPDTLDDQYETGSTRTALRPLLVQKNILETIKSLLISFYFRYSYFHIKINDCCFVK